MARRRQSSASKTSLRVVELAFALTLATGCGSERAPVEPSPGAPRRSPIEDAVTECYADGCDDLLQKSGFERIASEGCPPDACRGREKGGIERGARYRFVGGAGVLLFRGYSDPSSRLGHWWALERPQGTSDRYRKRFAICPEWNGLTEIVECPLRKGAEVVIGSGQSARCAGEAMFEASPVLQAYVVEPTQAFDMALCRSRPWGS